MTHSSRRRIDEIESWFRTHDDGEFVVLPSSHLSVRTGDFANARSIVYTTKPRSLPRMNLSQLAEPRATLGRSGLPASDDLPLVRGSSPARIFLGDADPPDLLAFAWLREQVPIVWHGVNDEFLTRHGTRGLASIRIPLSAAERQTVQHLPQLCPDFRELLGEFCASLLDEGFKIELEGALVDPRAEPVS